MFLFVSVFVFVLEPALKTRFILSPILISGLILYIFNERFAVYDIVMNLCSSY